MSKIFDSLRKADDAPSQPIAGTPAPAAPTPASSEQAASAPAEKFRVVRAEPSVDLPVLPFDGVHPPSAEQYRIIRTKIVQDSRRPRMIVVSSPGPGDGKTISSLNLAGALSLKGEMKVLLVECDFRRSSFCKLMQLPDSPGMIEVLAGKASLEDSIMAIEQLPNLYVLGPGTMVPNASELLDSPHGRAVFQTLRKKFHYVVVDSPPIGSIADYDVLQALADGLVVILRPDHTSRTEALQVLAQIPKEKLLGIVMNHVKRWFLSRKSAASSYYYYEQAGKN